MGLLKKQNNKQKKQEQEQQKELENRANQFIEEYKTLRKKYRCDIQSFIEFKETGILSKVKIVDAAQQIEKEEEAERKAEEEKQKGELKAREVKDDIKEENQNGNQESEN